MKDIVATVASFDSPHSTSQAIKAFAHHADDEIGAGYGGIIGEQTWRFVNRPTSGVHLPQPCLVFSLPTGLREDCAG